MRIFLQRVAPWLAILTLAGCVTSASMRIEVDVYKGPLANTLKVQEEQLKSVLNSSVLGAEVVDSQLVDSMCRIGCVLGPNEGGLSVMARENHDKIPTARRCAERAIPQRRVLAHAPLSNYHQSYDNERYSRTATSAHRRHKPAPYTVRNNDRGETRLGTRFAEYNDSAFGVCPVYQRMRQQLRSVLAHPSCPHLNPDPKVWGQAGCQIKDEHVVQQASAFRILATAVSYQIAAVEPADKRLRIDMTKLANLGAEYSNVLTSRVNALQLQKGDEEHGGIDRKLLATGHYLRDTKPTAFLDLYHWLDAATWGKVATPEERMRMVKQLVDDDNWSRVNEVYASGAGDTSMAFIKDGIGNWNLKNFENDPSELNRVVGDLSRSLVEKAIEMSSGGSLSAKQLQQIPQLLQLANDAKTGENISKQQLGAGAIIQSLDLASIRKELADSLKTELTSLQQKVAEIDNTIASVTTQRDDLKADIQDLQNDEDESTNPTLQQWQDLEKTEGQLETKQQEKAQLQVSAVAKARETVKRYELVIEAVQRVSAASQGS